MNERLFCRKESLGQSCLGCAAIDEVNKRAMARTNGTSIESIAETVETEMCPPGEELSVQTESRMSSLRWVRR